MLLLARILKGVAGAMNAIMLLLARNLNDALIARNLNSATSCKYL
jgi:hypothetical protein